MFEESLAWITLVEADKLLLLIVKPVELYIRIPSTFLQKKYLAIIRRHLTKEMYAKVETGSGELC